jgi:3-phenylpropionate/cinnamic acid dioxygenase small subunit
MMMSPEREIENLIYQYAELIDAGDLAGVGKLLSGARFISPDGDVLADGEEAIAKTYGAFTRIYEDGTPLSHHITSNVQVKVNGNRAEARSYFTVLQATESLPLQPVMAGRYVDEFIRDESGWHFSRRQIIPRLTGDISQHVLLDISPA